MKKSKIYITILVLILTTCAIAHAYFISENTKKSEQVCRPELELGKGEFFEDECFYSYSHIHVTVPDVELINNRSNYIKMGGYENAWWVQNMEVRNDTLFISKKDPSMPRYETDESINAVKYLVGGKDLKSITVGLDGSVRHPLKPFGSYDDGRPAYKKHDLKKHLYEFDSLEINIISNGFIDLLVKGKTLKTNFLPYTKRAIVTTQYVVSGALPIGRPGSQVLVGEVDNFTIDYSTSLIRVGAQYLDAKQVTFNKNKSKIDVNGELNVNVSDKLEAYLYSDLDVKYKGEPKIIKEETGYGRLINMNQN